jgi:triacylglycerol lipase
MTTNKHWIKSIAQTVRYWISNALTYKTATYGNIKMTANKQVDTQKTMLNEGTAYWMARIAQSVYQRKEKDGDKTFPDEAGILETLKSEDDGFLDVKGFSKKSAQGCVIEHQDYLCFGFRGTDEIADWLDNFAVSRESALFGEFHSGFWHSTEDLFGDMMKRYRAIRASAPTDEEGNRLRRPLFITGHSLGGAMATITAAHFVYHDLPFMAAYTFGQPRAMTYDTARIFNSWTSNRFYRFHNNNDLVPRVPGRIMGYSHVGQLIYIKSDGELHNDAGFWLRFLDAIEGAVEEAGKKGIDGIKDHGMDKYVAAVETWNKQF